MTAVQRTLFERETRAPHIVERDRSMKRVERNAGQEFGARARAFIVSHLREHGATSGEDLTDACKRAGIEPHDDRAFGPVFLKLSRDGDIESAGSCERRKGHGTRGGTIWRAT